MPRASTSPPPQKNYQNTYTSPPNIAIPKETPAPKLPNLLARLEVVVATAGLVVVEPGVEAEDATLVAVELELVK